MSQELLSNLFLPTGSNWTEHSFGSATTDTGVVCCASYSAGLAACDITWNSG